MNPYGRPGISEFQEFNGRKYWKRKETGYYYNRFNKIRHSLHRDVWEFHNSPIPPKYIVHHKDGNSSNNSIENLQLLPSQSPHSKHHWNLNPDKNLKHIKEIMAPAALEYFKNGISPEQHEKLSVSAKNRWDKIREEGKKIFQCSMCGNEYETYEVSRKKGFCSRGCKALARYRSGADNEERICQICGSSFITYKFKKARTCSNKCRSKAIHNTRLNMYKKA